MIDTSRMMECWRSSSSSSGEGGRGRREERRREGEGDGWMGRRVGVHGGNKRGSGLRAGSEGKGGGGSCRGQRTEATIERTDRLMVPVFCSRKTVAVGQSGAPGGQSPSARSPPARVPACGVPATPPPPSTSLQTQMPPLKRSRRRVPPWQHGPWQRLFYSHPPRFRRVSRCRGGA